MPFDTRLLKKAQPFSEADKQAMPLTAPAQRFGKEYTVLQNSFWQLNHRRTPKDDLFRLLFLFSPKVRLMKGNVDEKTEFTITAKEYADFTSMKLDSAYTALSKAVDMLFQHSVLYFDEDKQRLIHTRLVTTCSYASGSFYVTFSHFALFIMSVFGIEHPFTKLELKSAVSLSGHGLKLYPYFIQNIFRSSFDVSISDLKALLGISEASYADFKELKKMVLKPHIDMINRKTDITVSFQAVKKEGRKASHVGFTITKKKNVTPKQAESKEPPEQPPEEKEKQSIEQDEQQYAIQFVLDTLKAKNLYDRFKEGNESKVQVMSRILTDMKEGRHIYWQEKIKEFTHSIPLGLDGIGNR